MIRSRIRSTAKRKSALLSTFAVLTLFAACAVPVAPTGGPVDSQAPIVHELVPARDQTNVPLDQKDIRFTFSEYMNEGSFSQAFSISPEPLTAPKIRWRRKSAIVSLEESLLPNTTYVLALNNRLRDANGVAYSGATSFAFSTGERVSRGRIAGRVESGLDGSPIKNVDVFAYPLTDSITTTNQLPIRPKYRTQANDKGEFQFDYLTPDTYVVIAIIDRNNNRRADELELVAIGDSLTTVAQETEPRALRLLSFMLDNEPPVVRSVRASSRSRVTVRFSESVTSALGDWAIADSASGAYVDSVAAFVSPDNPRDVTLRTNPLPSLTYRIDLPAVADTAGNSADAQSLYFKPASSLDTTTTRLLSFIPPPTGADSVSSFVRRSASRGFGFELNEPAPVGATAFVRLTSSSGIAIPFEMSSTDGRSYDFRIPATVSPGIIRMELDGAAIGIADSIFVHYFDPLGIDELGSISGIVHPVGSNPVFVEAYVSAGELAGRANADSTGHFLLDELAPGTYRLRVVDDRNGNGEWDHGLFEPLSRSESLTFTSDTLTVRAKWESVMPDTLFVGNPTR